MKKITIGLFALVGLLLAPAVMGRPAHGGGVNPYAFTTIITSGDSNTQGVGLSSPSTQAYPVLLANARHLTLNNLGITSTQACDNTQTASGVFVNMTGSVSTPSLTNKTIYTIMFGTNDANAEGAGSYEAVYNSCHMANITWLAVPDSSKVNAQSCTKAGTWTNDTSPVTGFGVNSTINASTLTCSITTQGHPLYIWYQVTDGNGGVFTYSVDGGAPVSLNGATSPALATQLAITSGMVVERVTGLSAAVHSVVFTVTSATSGSNAVRIWALGSAPGAAYANRMTTIVGGVMRLQGDLKASDTLAYNGDAAALVTTLAGDNLPVFFAPTRVYAGDTGAEMNDNFHFNATIGHPELAAAFLTVVP